MNRPSVHGLVCASTHHRQQHVFNSLMGLKFLYNTQLRFTLNVVVRDMQQVTNGVRIRS